MANKSNKKRRSVSQTHGTRHVHKKDINEKRFEANKKRFDNLRVDFNILKPFGPRIARVQCPTVVTDAMIQITDNIIEDKNHTSWGKHLVGQIKEEPLISKELLIEEGVYDFFNGVLKHYLLNVLNELYDYTEEHYTLETAVKDMWSVHMEPNGEYNPLHYHTFCHISAVMYLKLPKSRPKRNIPYKADRDGSIEFVDHASMPESLDRGTMVVEPTTGTMFMWPAQLLHTVYPFLGDQERRSIAWNGVFRLTEKKTGNIIVGGNP